MTTSCLRFCSVTFYYFSLIAACYELCYFTTIVVALFCLSSNKLTAERIFYYKAKGTSKETINVATSCNVEYYIPYHVNHTY